MKRLLYILSIITCLCLGFVLLMFINPAVVGYDDGIGFFIEFICIILTFITIVSWVGFGISKKLKNDKVNSRKTEGGSFINKNILYVLLSISSLISAFLFVCFYMPKWLASIDFLKNIQHNISAGESYIVFLFWFITLFLTGYSLLKNRKNSSKKIFLILILLIFAEILLLPFMANFELIGNIYIIYTTFVHMFTCIFSLVQLKSVK